MPLAGSLEVSTRYVHMCTWSAGARVRVEVGQRQVRLEYTVLCREQQGDDNGLYQRLQKLKMVSSCLWKYRRLQPSFCRIYCSLLKTAVCILLLSIRDTCPGYHRPLQRAKVPRYLEHPQDGVILAQQPR